MRVSLNGLGVEFMAWNGIFESWTTSTRTNKGIVTTKSQLDGQFFILSFYTKNMNHILHVQV